MMGSSLKYYLQEKNLFKKFFKIKITKTINKLIISKIKELEGNKLFTMPNMNIGKSIHMIRCLDRI